MYICLSANGYKTDCVCVCVICQFKRPFSPLLIGSVNTGFSCDLVTLCVFSKYQSSPFPTLSTDNRKLMRESIGLLLHVEREIGLSAAELSGFTENVTSHLNEVFRS